MQACSALNQNIRVIAVGIECGCLERKGAFLQHELCQALAPPIPARAYEGPSTSYFGVAISAEMRAIAKYDVSANFRRTAVELPIREAVFLGVVDPHKLLVSPYAVAHLAERALVAAAVNFVGVETRAIRLLHAGR